MKIATHSEGDSTGTSNYCPELNLPSPLRSLCAFLFKLHLRLLFGVYLPEVSPPFDPAKHSSPEA